MKMKFKKIVILAFCLLTTTFIYAQNEPPQGRHNHQPGNDMNRADSVYKPTSQEMIFRELNDMVKQLSLTDSQTVLVKDILTNFHQSIDEMMKSTNKNKDAMKMIMDKRESDLKAVLTEEQWTQYQNIKAEQKKKFDKKPKHNSE
jgi:hypothetical protein